MADITKTITWSTEGHRGTRGQALTMPGPGLLAENSIPAFLYIFRQGIKSCELDIHLVEDIPYVYHDDYLNDGTDLERLLYAFLIDDPAGVRQLVSSSSASIDLRQVFGGDLTAIHSLIDADGVRHHAMTMAQKATLCALYTARNPAYLATVPTVTGGLANLRRLAILAAQDPAKEGKVYIGDCMQSEIEGLRLISNPYPDESDLTDVRIARKPLDVRIPSFIQLLQALDAAKTVEPHLDPRLNIELKTLAEVYDRDPTTLVVRKDSKGNPLRLHKDPALIVHRTITNFIDGANGYKPLSHWHKDKHFIFSSFSAEVLARIAQVSDIKYSALFASRQPRDWQRTARGDLYYREYQRSAIFGINTLSLDAHRSSDWIFARHALTSDGLFGFTSENVIRLLDGSDNINAEEVADVLKLRATHERIWDLTEEEFVTELNARIQPPPAGLGLKPHSVNVPIAMLTPKVVAAIKAIPAEICVWTANEPNPLQRPRQQMFDLLRYLNDAGVTTFITDHAEAYLPIEQEYIAASGNSES